MRLPAKNSREIPLGLSSTPHPETKFQAIQQEQKKTTPMKTMNNLPDFTVLYLRRKPRRISLEFVLKRRYSELPFDCSHLPRRYPQNLSISFAFVVFHCSQTSNESLVHPDEYSKSKYWNTSDIRLSADAVICHAQSTLLG